MPAPVRLQASSQQWKWEFLEARAFLTDTTLETGLSRLRQCFTPSSVCLAVERKADWILDKHHFAAWIPLFHQQEDYVESQNQSGKYLSRFCDMGCCIRPLGGNQPHQTVYLGKILALVIEDLLSGKEIPWGCLVLTKGGQWPPVGRDALYSEGGCDLKYSGRVILWSHCQSWKAYYSSRFSWGQLGIPLLSLKQMTRPEAHQPTTLNDVYSDYTSVWFS